MLALFVSWHGDERSKLKEQKQNSKGKNKRSGERIFGFLNAGKREKHINKPLF